MRSDRHPTSIARTPVEDLHSLISEHGATFGPWAPWIVLGLLLLAGVGIPLSEDVVNIPAGVLIGEGIWPLGPVLLAAYVGVIAGDVLWVALLRRFGTPLMHRRWFKRFVHPRRLLQVKHQIERRGGVVLAAARFIPGTRAPVITAAGLMHMPWRTFLTVECLCCLVTVPVQVGIGVLIGRQLTGHDAARSIAVLLAVVAAVMLTSAMIPAIIHHFQSKRSVPRAPAAWLREFRSPSGRPTAATATK